MSWNSATTSALQSTIMMSEEMYRTWLQPRLAKVIATVKRIKPDILIFYHTCGFVEPLIPNLIEAGIGHSQSRPA